LSTEGERLSGPLDTLEPPRLVSLWRRWQRVIDLRANFGDVIAQIDAIEQIALKDGTSLLKQCRDFRGNHAHTPQLYIVPATISRVGLTGKPDQAQPVVGGGATCQLIEWSTRWRQSLRALHTRLPEPDSGCEPDSSHQIQWHCV
jgi:hypothetical protein